MNSFDEILDRITGFLKRINPNYIVFSFFIGLASVLWIVNTLGKTYTLSIPVTFEYANVAQGYTIAEVSDTNFVFEVSGSGYSLLKFYYYDSKFPIPIDISEFQKDTTVVSEKIRINIHKTFVQANVYDFRIDSVSPLRVTLKTSKIITKRVPIVAQTIITFDEESGLVKPITLSPDSVTLTGAKIILDTIKHIKTPVLKYDNLSSSQSESFKLELIPNITYSQLTVDVEIEVDQIVTREIEIPLDFINFSDTEKERISEKNIIITVQTVEQDDYSTLDSKIKAELDYTKRNRKEQSITPILKGVPSQYKVISVVPALVSYKLK